MAIGQSGQRGAPAVLHVLVEQLLGQEIVQIPLLPMEAKIALETPQKQLHATHSHAQ